MAIEHNFSIEAGGVKKDGTKEHALDPETFVCASPTQVPNKRV